jgi:hypothetical protein
MSFVYRKNTLISGINANWMNLMIGFVLSNENIFDKIDPGSCLPACRQAWRQVFDMPGMTIQGLLF